MMNTALKGLAAACGAALLAWQVGTHADAPKQASFEGGTFELAASVPRAEHSRQPGSRKMYIVIDRYCNRLYLRTNDSVILDAVCSVGSGRELVDSVSGRRWRFDTPPGVYRVSSRLVNPFWRKPDWAFVEEGLPIPTNESERFDSEMMGDYAIGFGDGYFIHGTIYERLLGVAVTHGCVRLGSDDLRLLYERTYQGMAVYVY